MNSPTLFLAIARQLYDINSGGYKGGMIQTDGTKPHTPKAPEDK